jgi:hypothetical protein
MKRLFAAACLAAVVVLQPAGAAAQTCENYIPVVADGRIVGPVTAGAGNVAALYFFVAAGRSYTVEIASTGSSSPAAVTGGYAVDCPTVSGGWPSNIAMTPRSDGRVIRLTIAATASTYIVTRIPTGSVTYSVAETTLYSQSWSTVNGFFTQWGLQNTTDSPITGTLTVTESFGGSSTYTREVTLPANSGVFVTTLDTFVGGPIPAGRGGTARFSHNGTPGSVNGGGFLLSGTQIVPITFQTVREKGR